ncbi:hypothetical protein Tco_0207304, partial [Tanacetum coccineum]
MAEVSTQDPIVAKVSTQGRCCTWRLCEFYKYEVIDIAYKTDYDVQSSEDAGTDDDDDDEEYFLVDEENKLIEPDVDVHLFSISMDLHFDNINNFDSDPGNDDETNDYRRRRLAELSRDIE